MFKSIIKVALSPVDLAVSVVADAATCGGAITDKDKCYTAEAAERLMENTKNIVDPDEE